MFRQLLLTLTIVSFLCANLFSQPDCIEPIDACEAYTCALDDGELPSQAAITLLSAGYSPCEIYDCAALIDKRQVVEG